LAAVLATSFLGAESVPDDLEFPADTGVPRDPARPRRRRWRLRNRCHFTRRIRVVRQVRQAPAECDWGRTLRDLEEWAWTDCRPELRNQPPADM